MLLPSFIFGRILPAHSLYNPLVIQYGYTSMIMDIIDFNPSFICQYTKWHYEEWYTLRYKPILKIYYILEGNYVSIMFK